MPERPQKKPAPQPQIADADDSHMGKMPMPRGPQIADAGEADGRERQLLDALPLIVFECGLDGTVTFCNSKAYEVLGYTAEEIVGKLIIFTLIPAAEQERALREFGEAMRDAPPSPPSSPIAMDQSEFTLLRKDGTSFPAYTDLRPIHAGGELVGLRGVVFDITGQRAIEEALRRSESRFRSITEQTKGVTSIVGRDLRAIYVTPSILATYGYDPDSLVGRHCHEFTDSQGIPLFDAKVAEAIAAPGTTTIVENSRIMDAWGKWRHMETYVTAMLDTPGVEGIVLSYRDITQRIEAEEALKASESQLRTLMDTAPTGIVIHEDGIVQYANDEAARLYGVARDDLLGRGVLRFVHPDDRQRSVDGARAVMDKGTVERQVLFRLRQTSGSEVVVEATSSPLAFEGKQSVLVFMDDVTERKRAEDALRASEEQYRTLMDLAPVAIVVSADGLVLFANRAALTLVRYTGEDGGVGQPIFNWRHPDDLDVIRRRALEVMSTGQPSSPVETQLIFSDGTIVHVETRTARIAFEGRPALHTVVLDISARKEAEAERQRMEEQLRHTQKLESLGVMAGGIAHDFNNLMMGVLGNASLALLDTPPSAPARESLEDIERAALRAAELCNQLLAYSGKGKFVLQAVDLTAAVREMPKLLDLSVSKRARLVYECASGLPSIEVDPSQLRQVIMNLIINASEAIGDQEGVIRVVTRTQPVDAACKASLGLMGDIDDGDYVCLEVSDTGCGMDEATRSRIFDPFFTTKFTGRGLGLAAILGIVRGHNGGIAVKSAPGEGTQFQILFPVSSKSVAVPKLDIGGLARGTGKVLVVDDEPVVRYLAAKILSIAGYTPIEAADGRAALDILGQSGDTICLVLLDLTMPGLSGEETYRQIAAIRPTLPVLLSSGFSAEDVSGRLTGGSIVGFIQKPYGVEALCAEVRRALDRGKG